jgi:hypothetical protein
MSTSWTEEGLHSYLRILEPEAHTSQGLDDKYFVKWNREFHPPVGFSQPSPAGTAGTAGIAVFAYDISSYTSTVPASGAS